MLAQDTQPRDKRKADRSPRRPSPSQQLLTLRQLEQEYGVPYRSIYDMCVSGDLPYVRFVDDGRIWVRRKDWEALIERKTERARADD